MQADEFDDVVVGAGVVGLTTALRAARGGHRVLVLTAEPIGGGSSGRSAGAVSQLHGTAYRRLAGETARKNAIAYRGMNADGFAVIAGLLETSGAQHERRDAYLAALEPDGARRIDDEHLAAHRAGLRLEKRQRADLPFEHFGALRLPDQLHVDPRVLLSVLAREAIAAGAVVRERERVVDVHVLPRGASEVETGSGRYAAKRVVLATGTPILDRGLYAFKTQAFRLGVVEGIGGPSVPIVTAIGRRGSTTMVTDAHGRTRVIGEAHPVGTGGSELRRLDVLAERAGGLLPGFRREASWSGQDYRPFNPIAFVGALPRGLGAVSFATGFDGWGLTQGAAAGIRLANALLGEPQPGWATTIGRRATRPRSVGIGLGADARSVALRIGAFRRLAPADRDLLREGEGAVHRTDAGAVATSLVSGVRYSVLATCPRAGGAVAWNDLELSWDCPVCGARYSPDGAVLEGGGRDGLTVVAAG